MEQKHYQAGPKGLWKKILCIVALCLVASLALGGCKNKKKEEEAAARQAAEAAEGFTSSTGFESTDEDRKSVV